MMTMTKVVSKQVVLKPSQGTTKQVTPNFQPKFMSGDKCYGTMTAAQQWGNKNGNR
jgi:hypothetical protein